MVDCKLRAGLNLDAVHDREINWSNLDSKMESKRIEVAYRDRQQDNISEKVSCFG